MSKDPGIKPSKYPSRPLPHPYADILNHLGWEEPLRWQYYRSNPAPGMSGWRTRVARIRDLHGRDGWPLPLPYERWIEFKARQFQCAQRIVNIEDLKLQFQWRTQYDASLLGPDGGVIPDDEQAGGEQVVPSRSVWDGSTQIHIPMDSRRSNDRRAQPEASDASQLERAAQPTLQFHMPLPKRRDSPMLETTLTKTTLKSFNHPREPHQYDVHLKQLGWSEPLLWQYYRANPPANNLMRAKRVELVANFLYSDWPLPRPYETLAEFLTRLGVRESDPARLAEVKLQFSWREKFDSTLGWEGCEAWFI